MEVKKVTITNIPICLRFGYEKIKININEYRMWKTYVIIIY